MKKSDEAIVPVKEPNKGTPVPAEALEERASTKGNSSGQSTRRTQCRESVSQAANRIRQAVARDPTERLTAVHHHLTVEALEHAFYGLGRNAAAGVDGVTWRMYAEELDRRLPDLHRRVQEGTYRAPPVRRVEIPKPDGGTRPLGIATLEDKVVQKAVVDVILTPVYEAEFLGFSYGFRPGRSAHSALDALAFTIERRKVNFILDADVQKYFDSIPRNQLEDILALRIGDRRTLRLLSKWLHAGIMVEGKWMDTGLGTPQGAVISPILSNIFLHHVLDLWFHQWRQKNAKGEAYIVRYADDFVLGFQYERDALRCLADLRERFRTFGLTIHPEKTRLVEFGRFASANRQNKGLGKPETFSFLGFEHFCSVTRRGRFRLGRKPIRKRVQRTMKRVGEVLRRRMHADIWEVGAWLGRVLNGWLNYYAVPGAMHEVRAFVRELRWRWMRVIRRRSQRHRFSWNRLIRMTEILWPRIRIRHPWPAQRFADTHPR